jgi:hypothetical protein
VIAVLLGILALSVVYGTPTRWLHVASFDYAVAWISWSAFNLALLGAAMVTAFGWPR